MGMTDLEKAARLALEALELRCGTNSEEREPYGAITALRRALEQPAQKRPQNCGTGYCSCIECLFEPEQPAQQPVAWMYEWITPDGEFVQGMTTDDLSSLKNPIGKITNIRPLYFANSESTADVAVYQAFEKFGDPTAFICQGNLYWGTDIDPNCTANHIPLYTRPQAREPLTDEQRNWIVATCPTPRHIIDTVEKMHGIKGDA